MRSDVAQSAVRLWWLTRYGAEGASSRYRVGQYVDALTRSGYTSTIDPMAPWKGGAAGLARGVARRLRMLRQVDSADVDVVVIQKEPVMPPMLWPLVRDALASTSTRLVWDVDDAVWLGRTGARRMAIDLARAADLVVAGNPSIAEWMANAGAKRTAVIPTCFAPPSSAMHDERNETNRGDSVEVVWVGSPATAELLARERHTLDAVLSVPGVRLTLVGGSLPEPYRSDHRVTSIGWSAAAEHKWLSRADFGLALQPRTEYADHKCGFKIVQYMAYGVVPIATDNPVHSQIVGDRGLLVGNAEGADRLRERLSTRPIGAERSAVTLRWSENFSPDVGCTEWRRLLDTLRA